MSTLTHTLRSRALSAVLLSLATLAPHVGHALTPIEAGTNANTWVLDGDGEIIGSYRVGTGYAISATSSGGPVTVSTSGGTNLTLPGTTSATQVLVNAVAGSLPAPLLAPPMSVVGLAAALSDASNPTAPSVTLTPSTGTYSTTTRVEVAAYPAPAGTGALALYLTVDGAPEVLVDGTSAAVTLVFTGEHVISARAEQGSVSAVATAVITLEGLQARRRDSDGDGIPDFVEVQKGLDPLRDDTQDDRDHDGWTDLEEVLRDSDPEDATSVPLDSDGDGWSDWDEEVRGTATDDAAAHPTARDLDAVEYLVSGATWDDNAQTAATADTGLVLVTDTTWHVQGWAAGAAKPGPSAAPLTPEALSAGNAWLLLSDRYQSVALAAFGPLRVPGDSDLVVAARAKAEPRRIKKAWLSGSPNVHPADVAALLEASGASWNTAAEWRAAYEAALADALVVDVAVDLAPRSALGSGLAEVVVAWTAALGVGAPVQLGEPDGARAPDAVAAFPGAGALNDAAALANDPLQGGLSLSVLTALFGPSGELSATRALAERLQRALPGTGEAQLAYQARLVAFVGRAAVDAFVPLPGQFNVDPWRPTDDADSDGLSNEAELAAGPFLGSDPLYPDTDDDGLGDLADPCPRDPSNSCLASQSFASDTDNDGVLDAIDNCFGVKNRQQLDGNGDLIGDACEAAARIGKPVADLEVLAGSTVSFTSLQSSAVSGAVSLRWTLNGVEASTATAWSFVADPAVWGAEVTVRLYAAVGGASPVEVDHRTVSILSLEGPVACLAISCDDGDPCTDDACDLVTGCYSTPLVSCQACGDALDCDDGNACTADSCVDGVCSTTTLTAVPCDDGNACTINDHCVAGACSPGGAKSCDDGDPCTVESCVAPTGCVVAPNPNPDPVLCPECVVDGDCGAGSCVGGICCDGNLALDMPTVWNPGDPPLRVCITAGAELALTTSSTVAGLVSLRAPSGVVLVNKTAFTAVYYELEGAAESGTYTLTLGATAPVTVTMHTSVDEHDEIAGFGQALTTPVGTVGAEIYQTFAATAGMRFYLETTVTQGGCSTLQVLAPDGSVSFNSYSCGAHSLDAQVLDAAGVYTVLVDPATSNAVDVKTTVWALPATDPVGTATVGGPAASVALPIPGMTGTLTFQGVAGQRVALLSNAATGCSRYELTAPSGTVLKTFGTACGVAFTEAIVLPETGTYVWTIDPAGKNVGTTSLTIYLLPDTDPVVATTVGGGAVTLSLPYPGLAGSVVFSASAGQRISIAASRPSTCYDHTLRSPSGAVLWTKFACGSTFMDAITLTETGDYVVLADPSATGFGDSTITVYAVPADAEFNASIGGGAVVVANTVPGQNVVVHFTGTAGQGVVYSSVPGVSKFATYTVLAPDGSTVQTSGSKISTYVSPTVTLPVDGAYRLLVDLNGADVHNTTITLSPP